MKHPNTRITTLLLAVFLPGSPICAASQVAGQAEVNLASLLKEMTDRDALARYPQPGYQLRQFSSYNRESKTPDEVKGWFNNKDHNNFIRVEGNQGRREWVIMDHEAPGVIVRSWMPDKRIAPGGKAPVNTVMRIYLDGADTPVIEGNMLDLFNGTGLIPPPYAHQSLSSAVSFFPIAYAKRCKITLNAAPFFYIFNCREYPAGTPVRTFSKNDLQSESALIQRVGQRLLEPALPALKPSAQWQGKLAAKAEAVIPLPPGPGAVRQLTLKLAKQDEQITRSLVLKIEFDGRPSVWCPAGDFFGTGLGLNPFQDWYRTVAADGTMTCRWVMPYRQSGTITLVNLHDQAVEAALDTTTGDWAWDERTMYFHTTWRHQNPVPTRPYSDWNYVTLTGRGVYVGDALTVINPVEKWWGEGDEKIRIDGESFPSLFGTGTEDYYGYSWGGRNADFYQHPFHAQVRAGPNNSQTIKSPSRQSHTQGVSTQTRTRALDAMTCSRSLQLDMEVWHWAECNMDYSVAAYWYGFGDTTSNLAPAPAEAAAKVIVPPPAASK